MITHDVESKLIARCDRILVLAPGGKMAYFGPPQEGLRYFGAADWGEVFDQFGGAPLQDWAGQFHDSPEHARYVAAPLAARLRQPSPHS